MSHKEIQGPAVSKAGLSEIFAAMRGVISAGLKNENQALYNLAMRGAYFAPDCRAALMRDASTDNQEKVAHRMLTWLAAGQPCLLENASVILHAPPIAGVGMQTGGTALDVSNHIAYMLHREKKPDLHRAFTKISNADGTVKAYKASYLPEFYAKSRTRAKAEEGASEETRLKSVAEAIIKPPVAPQEISARFVRVAPRHFQLSHAHR